MEERDPMGLVGRMKQAVDHVHETGGLRPSDLQLPIYASPQYNKELLPGYEGGSFDPETLGAACIVVPKSKGFYTNASWSLNPVPPPPTFLTSRPSPRCLPDRPCAHAMQLETPAPEFP